MPDAPSTSTVEVAVDIAADRRGRVYRRMFVAMLAVVVAIGAGGVLGVRTDTVSSSGRDGHRLQVSYPRVTRAGLPATMRIDVQRRGGIDSPVTLGINADYLELFDEQGVRPSPDSSFARGDLLVMEFEPPDQGDAMTVRVDVILETGVHFGKDARVVLLDDAGGELASVSFTTRIAP